MSTNKTNYIEFASHSSVTEDEYRQHFMLMTMIASEMGMRITDTEVEKKEDFELITYYFNKKITHDQANFIEEYPISKNNILLL